MLARTAGSLYGAAVINQDALNVFVYGTLQPGGHYHDEFCAHHSFTAHRAWVSGRLFDFPARGYPAAAEDSGGRIYGYLLSFEPPAPKLLRTLDQLEGYDPQGSPADNLYYRTEVTARLLAEETITMTAWCYFMPAEQIHAYGGVELATGCWR